MTPEEMRKMTDWNDTQEAIDKYAQSSFKSYEDTGQLNIQHGTPYIEVYERYAEVPRSYLTNDGVLKGDGSKQDNDFVYARFICAGVDNVVVGESIVPSSPNPNNPYYAPGIILFSEEVDPDDDPFKEVHFRKTKGRWLGIGIIEDTFEDQRLLNKNKDQEDKANELAALILLQTSDDMVARNVLTDVDNGEILKSKTGITRVDNELRSLPAMQEIAKAYELHADLETFSADHLGGKQTPATATLGAVQAQTNLSSGVYDYKKQNYGLFLEEFIKDLVFPDLQKKIMSPHTLRFQGDLNEMAKLRERVVDGYMRKQILESGDIPDQQTYDMQKQQFIKMYQKEGSQMWIDIEKDFFKNLDYELSLEITGEGKDTQTWLNNLSAVFKLVGSNPLIFQNPLLKRLMYKMLSAMGMSISELENADAEISQEVMDLMIASGMRRTIRSNIDYKNLDPNAQKGLLQRAGINDTPPQQGQPTAQPGQMGSPGGQ